MLRVRVERHVADSVSKPLDRLVRQDESSAPACSLMPPRGSVEQCPLEGEHLIPHLAGAARWRPERQRAPHLRVPVVDAKRRRRWNPGLEVQCLESERRGRVQRREEVEVIVLERDILHCHRHEHAVPQAPVRLEREDALQVELLPPPAEQSVADGEQRQRAQVNRLGAGEHTAQEVVHGIDVLHLQLVARERPFARNRCRDAHLEPVVVDHIPPVRGRARAAQPPEHSCDTLHVRPAVGALSKRVDVGLARRRRFP